MILRKNKNGKSICRGEKSKKFRSLQESVKLQSKLLEGAYQGDQ